MVLAYDQGKKLADIQASLRIPDEEWKLVVGDIGKTLDRLALMELDLIMSEADLQKKEAELLASEIKMNRTKD